MMSDLQDEEKRGYLKDEWLLLQNQYEDFDRRSLTIEGWLSTGSIAGLAIAFGTTVNHRPLIPLMVAIIAGVFWYLEAYWKLFQYGLADRIRVIEAYFRKDPDILFQNPDPFQVYHYWYQSYAHDRPIFPYETVSRPRTHISRIMRVAFQRFVFLPYLVIIILSLVASLILAFDIQGTDLCGV